MLKDDIFFRGNTRVWGEECKPWAEAVLEICAIAITSLPHRFLKGNIELAQQFYGENERGGFTAELKGGQSSYWIMHHELNSREIVQEALRGVATLDSRENWDGTQWTERVFAEQINARLGNSRQDANLPPSGVYHYGDFVAMAMNGSDRRFIASVSFAEYISQRIYGHDLVLCAMATALSQIFGGDAILVKSYETVLEDLISRAKCMHWSHAGITNMAERIRLEFKIPSTPVIIAWKEGSSGDASSK